jgi:hypothetical protein
MATYRALQDIYLGGNWPYAPAGTTLTDQAPNPNIPQGWVPPAAVDPLDDDAVNAFWNAGVQLLGPVRVAPPKTYWTPYPSAGGTRPYILTGLGAWLGFRNWLETRGVAP